MEIFASHRALFRPLSAPAVALGNFDGVHRGHVKLFEAARAAATTLGGESVVLTFDPHPAQVLAPSLAPRLITSRERKLELIAGCGIDVCIVEPFTEKLAALSAEEFLQRVLVDVIGARHVVVGYDFTYGKDRVGTADALRGFGQEHGFATDIIAKIAVKGVTASSTKVRNFVAAGKLEGARMLLGRNFDYDGEVVMGAGRGRTIGIPTANINVGVQPGAMLLPPGGVYAVRVQILDDEKTADVQVGVANIGFNPTFVSDGDLSLEVHLLDFDGDLVGRRLRVRFVERLRGERRFENAEALVTQIRRDIDTARAVFGRPRA